MPNGSIAPLQADSFLLLQICHEFERFSAYMQKVKVGNFFGGLPVKTQKKQLKEDCPNIIVGTPGRLKQVGRYCCTTTQS